MIKIIKDLLNIRTIDIDINKKFYETITVKEDDVKSRYLNFRILDNGKILDLTTISVRVYSVKKDNTISFVDLSKINANKGIAQLEFTSQMLSISGNLDLELVLTSGESKLSTNILKVEVIKCLNNSTAVESRNEFTALQEALKTVNSIENKADITYVNDSIKNIDKISGKTLTNGNDVLNKIPWVGTDGGIEIGSYLDFHINGSSNDNDGRITLGNDSKFAFNRPVNTYEFLSQYLILKTFGNGDYGPVDYAKIWFDNRKNLKKLIFDNVSNLLVPSGKITATNIESNGNIDIYNGSLRDTGDNRVPYLGTRRNQKAWAFADTEPSFWSVFAKSFDINSDERIKNIKENKISDLYSDLEIVNNISPKKFSYIDEIDTEHYGFIAQELEPFMPSAIKTIEYTNTEEAPKDKKGNPILDFKLINPVDLIATLWNATKELSQKLQVLENKINSLENKIPKI